MGDYSSYLIQQILQRAGSEWDFERFCVRHYSHIEGFQYVPTSRNYDVGIDGDLKRWRVNGGSYIIASLQKRETLASKAAHDLKRLLKADPSPGKVRICFAQLSSNQARLEIKKLLKKIYPRAEYDVSGIAQLTDEVDRHSGAFADVYENQLDEARRQMEQYVDRTGPAARRLGFRVLLAVQLDGNAIELRCRILHGLVLSIIQPNGEIDQQDLLRAVSDAIGLDRPIHASYLAETLTALAAQDLIEISASKTIRRRRAADDLVLDAGRQAASKILDGYGAFKQALDSRLREPLSVEEYGAVWNIIKQGLVRLFRTYGMDIVDFILGLNGDSSTLPTMPTTLYEGLQHIAENLDAADLFVDDRRFAELIRVIPIALLDEETGTRKWVARLCLAYLCACSLGLHPDALKRLEVQLRTWDVIPDTHVVLSALGEGEPDHAPIRQLLAWWIESGGRLRWIQPVLDETLHHAQLGSKIADGWAERYRKCRGHWRPVFPQANVFLRCIAKRHPDPVPSHAQAYLSQFAGSGSDPTLSLRRILEDEYHFTTGPLLQVDAGFQSQLYAVNAALRLRDSYATTEEKENAEARCKHDAATLAYLSVYRQSIGSNRTAIILSHSSYLRRISEQFHTRFGYGSPCIDPARLLFALSLNPGTGFNLATIESALFGEAFQRQVALHEVQAQKVADKLVSEDSKDFYTSTLQHKFETCLIGPWRSKAGSSHRVGRGVLRKTPEGWV